MRSRLLGIACVCAIGACSDGIGMPIGTADLAFEGSGSATVAWAIARSVGSDWSGWSLFFGATGSAATSCNDPSAPYLARADLWLDGSATDAPAPLPADEYRDFGCGSGGPCSSVSVTGATVDWAEIELLECTDSYLRGSLMGSAGALVFYGEFEAAVCPGS